MGAITEIATAAPGYNSLRPNTKAPLPLTLKMNGYATAQFGKCHEVPAWQTSPMGPFDAWPAGGGGFEYFYGFIGGETSQYDPALYEGTTPVEPPATAEEGYHLTEDMTDRAIGWVSQQKALMPDKPFFVTSRRRRPRSRTTCRRSGPTSTRAASPRAGTSCARRRSRGRRSWASSRRTPSSRSATRRFRRGTSMPAQMKPVLERQMEVYAGFLEHTDHHVGRLVDALENLGVLENTLVYDIFGDNGASAEGTHTAPSTRCPTSTAWRPQTPEFMLCKIDEFGSRTAFNHYSPGWARATDAPYQWTKQVASHWAASATARSSTRPGASRRAADPSLSSPT